MTSTSSDDVAAKLDSIRDSLLVLQSLVEEMGSRLARVEAGLERQGPAGTEAAPPPPG